MNKNLRQLDFIEMGNRIRQKREFLKMSREELAEYLDVTPQFIADLEYGNKGTTLKNFYQLCQALKVSADYILAGERENEDKDADLMRAREKVMGILYTCDKKQLEGITGIAQIYADGVKMK